MNSWKSINLDRQFGNQFIFFLSMMTMFFSFIVIYLSMSVFFPNVSMHDDYGWILLFSALFLYPIHKLMHCCPCILEYPKIKPVFYIKWRVLPLISFKIGDPIPKRLYRLTLLFPFLVLTSVLIGGAYEFPHYAHYFAILLSIHTGLCVSDFIAIKCMKGSPEQSYVEETEQGYDILIFKE
ncbi:DUF3267 domain-containing protein [Bacillus cihuensis]|uniref:DUF3267 domain-containing protein n=1 Tax=Bacillus cihuensis TaxID=1208599 RepID=UPI000401ACDB|nr:DUF3267 domain-containing protein [Bacillus cihuensis]